MDVRKIAETVMTHGVIAVLAVACGYLFGTSETAKIAATAAANSTAIVEIKALQRGRRTFINDTADRLELLCRKDPECWQSYGKMERPE